MQEKLALNVKIPRLARNRLGVFCPLITYGLGWKTGCLSVILGHKRAEPGKVVRLEILYSPCQRGDLARLSTYIVDLKNGRIEADGEDDHFRAMEAQKIAVQAQDRQLEAKQLEIQLAEIRLREREVDKIMAEINPGRQIAPDLDARSSAPSSSSEDVGGFIRSAPALPMQPRKHLFPSSKPVLESAQQLSSTHKIQVPGDYSLKDEMERHILEEERRGKVDQTIGEKKAVFADFLALYGEDIGLNAITSDDVTTRWRATEFRRPNKKHKNQTLSCSRRLNIDPPCRSKFDPGRVAAF